MGKIFLIVFLLVIVPIFSQDSYTKRYGLIVGCNKGNSETTDLEYSVEDAKNFADVMVNLGGIEKDNMILLNNPRVEDIKKGFTTISNMMSNDSDENRGEILFYYSGHSDKLGLLIHNNSYSFQELKSDLNSLNSKVKIVILDSCYSGEFTRFKGGVRKAPFTFDSSINTSGQAILTSSSSDEESQESDIYGSSFFSHALITGLRGAADSNSDKRVTLNEAYQFAFDETLRMTQHRGEILQHPSYNISLKGTGNLILTDLGSDDSKLIFPNSFYGKILLRDSNRKLVTEFIKNSGGSLELSLDRGDYTIEVIKDDSTLIGSFSIQKDKSLSAGNITFNKKRSFKTLFKGGEKSYFYPAGFKLPGYLSINLFSTGVRDISIMNLGLLYTIADGNSTGVEISPIFNFNRGVLKGTQIGSVNLSTTLTGGQVGVFNNSKDFKGIQIGLVNKAEKGKGVQLGVVNISDELNGLPIGIIDIQRNGQNFFNTWIETDFDKSHGYSSFRFGSSYLYKQITIGTGELLSQEVLDGSASFDLGLRLPLYKNQASILSDAGVEISAVSNPVTPKISSKIEYQINPRLGFVIGGIARFNNREELGYLNYDTPFGETYIEYRLLGGLEFR